MKYDLFERLNTGGARLSAQEIRNCVFRAVAPDFMDYVDELASYPVFSRSLRLSDTKMKSKYDRGLVLRFFSFKNNMDEFRHDVEPFITDYVHQVVRGDKPFDLESEASAFKTTMSLIGSALGADAWRHRRNGQSMGSFSVYVFEALSIGACKDLKAVQELDENERRRLFNLVKEDRQFNEATGPGGNTKPKLLERIGAAERVMSSGEAIPLDGASLPLPVDEDEENGLEEFSDDSDTEDYDLEDDAT
jgi:hypothetical protein